MKNRKFCKKFFGIALLMIVIFLFIPVIQVLKLPSVIDVFQGDSIHVLSNSNVNAKIDDAVPVFAVEKGIHGLYIDGEKVGEQNVVFNLAGIPIKKSTVRVLKEMKVIPGGQSIGVQLNTLGVLVVGYHQINSTEGKLSPGEAAGIRVGDIISKINGNSITNMNDLTQYLENAQNKNSPLKLTIIRNKETFETDLTPAQDSLDKNFKIGLYVRDSASGIGTLTFIDPISGKYGALGHVISDADTKAPIVVKDGTIYNSTVTSIDKGTDGNPGEKLARFSTGKEKIGTINSNTPFGIFGTLSQKNDLEKSNIALPIALSSQVKKGPAQILTVVDGNKIERFDIEIVNSVPQKIPAIKGIIIKVTDKRLLEKTGGIVQGMSGSPIIQDGKLVGAVTHVFVNDPTSGYGVHIEWMLREAGIDIYKAEKQAG
ncbi:MAG: SpoIVB peptidase [Bacillales bacterium]|jgi:stage IV sporulation protein B|nr:SpoIVB peptidase [Bacillales bacterium]